MTHVSSLCIPFAIPLAYERTPNSHAVQMKPFYSTFFTVTLYHVTTAWFVTVYHQNFDMPHNHAESSCSSAFLEKGIIGTTPSELAVDFLVYK